MPGLPELLIIGVIFLIVASARLLRITFLTFTRTIVFARPVLGFRRVRIEAAQIADVGATKC